MPKKPLSLTKHTDFVFPPQDVDLGDIIGVFYRIGNGKGHYVPNSTSDHAGSFRPAGFTLNKTQARLLKAQGCRIETVPGFVNE